LQSTILNLGKLKTLANGISSFSYRIKQQISIIFLLLPLTPFSSSLEVLHFFPCMGLVMMEKQFMFSGLHNLACYVDCPALVPPPYLLFIVDCLDAL
jgi:hypothetical protein